MKRKTVPALAYLRTSSAANVGAEKDSEKRQRAAIESFAKSAGYAVEEWFNDAAVSGSDDIDTRAGFTAMLRRIAGNGVRVIIVETANRFARDLIVQETGYRKLRELGVELIAADSPEAFVHDTPTATMVRQILGAVAQFEKAALVAKLKGARDRKRATGAKVEGRKSHAQKRPEAVALAKRLRRKGSEDGKSLSYAKISDALAAAGHLNDHGQPFNPKSVRAMLRGAA